MSHDENYYLSSLTLIDFNMDKPPSVPQTRKSGKKNKKTRDTSTVHSHCWLLGGGGGGGGRAKVDNNFAMAIFDMQQVLLTPKTDASPVYYSRKLNTYNLTIFDMKTNHARNYVWDETNGKRGSCEVGSVLYKYIETLPSHISELELISDKCGGQNRICLSWLWWCTPCKTVPH